MILRLFRIFTLLNMQIIKFIKVNFHDFVFYYQMVSVSAISACMDLHIQC